MPPIHHLTLPDPPQSVCDDLGVTLAQHNIGVGTTVTVLGLKISTNPLQLTIPEEKLAKYYHAASTMLQQSASHTPILISDIETLLGYLEHVSKVFAWGRLFLNSFRWASRRHSRNVTICLPTTAHADLRFWNTLLYPNSHSSYLIASAPSIVGYPTADFYLITDASSVGAGAYLKTIPHHIRINSWSRPFGPEEFPAIYGEDQDHICVREALSLVEGALALLPPYTNLSVFMYSDNVGAISFLQKGTIPANQWSLLSQLRSLAQLCLDNHLSLCPRWVSGPDVVVPSGADYLSRNPQHSHHAHSYRFNLSRLPRSFPTPTIDAAADHAGTNANAPTWLHIHRPIEQYWHQLRGHTIFANPLWTLIDIFFAHLLHVVALQPQDTTALLLVPDQPLQAWYQRYLSPPHSLIRHIMPQPRGRRLFQEYEYSSPGWRNAGSSPHPYLRLFIGLA